MRKTLAVLAVIAAVSLSAPTAFAYTCNSRVLLQIGPGTYYEYIGNPLDTSDSTCWSLGGSSPVWSSGVSEWEFTTWNDQTAIQTVTAAGTSTSYTAQLNVDFNDSNASWWNALSAQVDVNHNGSHTYYTIFSIIGSGGVTTASGNKFVNFTAQPGDSITITVQGRNSYYGSGTVVRFSNVHLWQNGA
ncbi:MAG TPA: hypothetical protein VKB93_22835 [Thermoanaerobaculia bacterium]|nr:hypothetical protein [Thermoanaerobaculia bacterium]